MNRRYARLAGGGVLILALAVAAEATTFRVAFPTDPLGPAAFPFLAAFLLALGGLALLMEGGWGSGEPMAEPEEGGVGGGPMLLAAGAFAAYALVLPVLGFVPATTAAFAALALLFGGSARQGVLAGLAFSVALFALFVWGLGLPLPVWPWPLGR